MHPLSLGVQPFMQPLKKVATQLMEITTQQLQADNGISLYTYKS